MTLITIGHIRIILPAVVKVKIGLALDAPAGEAVVRVERATLVAVETEGHVALFADAGAAGGQRQRSRRVVGEGPVQNARRAGDAHPAGEVVWSRLTLIGGPRPTLPTQLRMREK